MKIDPTFAESFRFKGIVLSAQELHDQALIAFSQAHRIEKDMASYNGKLCADNIVVYMGVVEVAITGGTMLLCFCSCIASS